ncbi:LCP family protein [Bifidobacterium sp. CP2]|uniref:LCP family protein n=1 Tax=Bifidobacterium sp. CP2 TaxID=2809025 RepID=UPI001F0B49E8|nr:LCP family protein [Bifidobacterium sp. CP2]
MTLEGDGMGSQATPPSFIPAGSRRRPPAAPSVPHVGISSDADTGDGDMRRVAVPRSSSAASRRETAVPPSFTPPTQRRAGERRVPQPSQPTCAAQPASFTPRTSSSHRDAAVSARTRNPRVAGSQRGAGLEDALPARPTRRSAGSTSVASIPTDADSRLPRRRTARPMRPRHAGRTALVAVALLLVALALAVFGAWNWVDSRLNKESGWLTGSANTHGESWLILGSDERDGTTGGSADDTPGFRTDTILVLTKPNNGASSLISIPRDSLVQVDGTYMKINAVAQMDGGKALVSTVERITGQNIDHIAKIKFGGLKHVVDAIGGVELCYDQTVNDAKSGLDWTAGCHVADGDTALAFSRMRYSDANGDFGRAQRQRQVIAAIVKKASSKEVLASPPTVTKTADAGLAALTVDDKTNPLTLLDMALAFKAATGSKGITGSVYWTNPDYQVSGVGSSVLLDDSRNTELFSELAAGTHAAGTVGTLAESQQSS